MKAILAAAVAAVALMGSPVKAQNVMAELGAGKICAGSLSSANGPGGASAVVFSRDPSGQLAARLYFAPGHEAKAAMAQSIAAGTLDLNRLKDLGYASRVQVIGSVITFERWGPDPRTGAQVAFRTFRFTYVNGTMAGQSTPNNDVMEDGRPGVPTQMSLTCVAVAQRQAQY